MSSNSGVQVVLDVLSAEAFNAGVRRGAYGESFADFLPLALEPRHFQRALPRIEKALAGLATQNSAGSAGLLARAPPRFAPWMALTVLPAAMNAFVAESARALAGAIQLVGVYSRYPSR